MKKYIIGALIGFVLSLGVGAHAEVVNMIGKVIDGAFPVKVNGNQINSQAITIEGTSYLPVRAIGDALGMDVLFNADLGIELKSKGGNTFTTIQELKDQEIRSQKIQDLNAKITVLMNQENAVNAIIGPYKEDSRLINGVPSKKEKDATYFEAIKNRDDIKKKLEEFTKERDTVVKEQNDFAESKRQQILQLP